MKKGNPETWVALDAFAADPNTETLDAAAALTRADPDAVSSKDFIRWVFDLCESSPAARELLGLDSEVWR